MALQIVTGIVLAMHYDASGTGAFMSVERHIMRDVNYGWLIRGLHANGASMFFLAVYLHILRGIYYGSYKAPREVLWLLGCVIYVLMMATAFMGYVLPWGQMSFWGAKVITNLLGAFPIVGNTITSLLWGGFSVDSPTLEPLLLAALPAAVRHRRRRRPAHLGAARTRQQQSGRHQYPGEGRHRPVPPLLHGEGRLRDRPVHDPVRGVRLLSARRVREVGQRDSRPIRW